MLLISIKPWVVLLLSLPKIPARNIALKITPGMDHSLFPRNNLLHNEMRYVRCFVLKTWTKDLCRKDSDGDGKTNGEELGDPDCEWSPNSVPKSTVNLSHPGKWPGIISNSNSIFGHAIVFLSFIEYRIVTYVCLNKVNTIIFLNFFQAFANHWMIQNVQGKMTFYNAIPSHPAIWKGVKNLRWDDVLFFFLEIFF